MICVDSNRIHIKRLRSSPGKDAEPYSVADPDRTPPRYCIESVSAARTPNTEHYCSKLQISLKNSEKILNDLGIPVTMDYMASVLLIRIRIRGHMFLGLLDPDPLVRGMDPDPLVRGIDPRIQIRIRIHTKMSWICNTGW
jgi:hypothetical protein